jgi:hypothetical protein
VTVLTDRWSCTCGDQGTGLASHVVVLQIAGHVDRFAAVVAGDPAASVMPGEGKIPAWGRSSERMPDATEAVR